MLRRGQVAIQFTPEGVATTAQAFQTVGAASEDAGRKIDSVGGAAERTGGNIESLGSALKNTLGGIGVAAVVQFVTRSIVEFQKLEAQLTTFTGSFERTGELMAKFRADNSRTGLNVTESAQAFITLRTQGIEPTLDRLQAIGNISAQTGKSIEDVAAAFGNAARGQFRSLTQLGAQFREENDQIVVTFTDGTRQIINSADEATAALERLGNVDFAGAKARDATTLAGSFDDLRNAASELAVEFGKSSGVTDGLTGAFRGFTLLTESARSGSEQLRTFNRDAGAVLQTLSAVSSIVRGDIGGAGRSLADLLGLGAGPAGPRASAGGSIGPGASVNADGQLVITRELDKATKDLIDTLDEQAAAYGKTRVQALELAKAQALAKASTDAERAAIAASYDNLIRTVRATDAVTAATKARTKAEIEADEALKEKQAIDAQNAAVLEQLKEQLRDLTSELDGVPQAFRRAQPDVDLLIKSFQLGIITLEEFSRRFAQVYDAASAANTRDLADKAREDADRYVDVWEDRFRELSSGLGEILGDVFGDAGRSAADVFVRYLQDRAQRAGFRPTGSIGADSAQLGRGFEMQGGFVGPPTALSNDPATAGAGNQDLGGQVAQVTGQIARQLGVQAGGNGQGAEIGAAIGGIIGSYFGPVGYAIGAFLGGLIGGAFDKDPKITVSNNPRGQESTGRSVFGTFGASTRNTDLPVRQVIQAVQLVDSQISTLLTADERDAARRALASTTARSQGEVASIDKVISQRVATIISAVEPMFAAFLNGIEDVEQRIKQFEALRFLKDLIAQTDRTVAEAFGDPLEAQQARFERLTEGVTKAQDKLAAAIDSQDFVQAAEAATELQESIIELAQAQIDAVKQIEQSLISLDQQSRAFALSIEQRIAGVSGGALDGVLSLLSANVQTTRNAVLTARTPEQSLAYLSEFIATVDAWLQQSTAEVQRLLRVRLAELDEERNDILTNAQLRADAAAQVQALQDDINQRMIEALQRQLALAQQWAGVVDRTTALLDQLRFGAANPIGLQSQFANLGSEADALFAQFGSATGSNRVDIANRLLDILTQQQQVGASLFDRPSDESVALYNQIVGRINAVREVAQPEAERAAALQQQIADLQAQTVGAVRALTDATYYLTAEERQRLDEIEDERRAAEEAAQTALDEINAQAREYYTWARTQGVALQQQQRDILQEQLDAITGGVDIQQFIATTQRQARDALYTIRDDLRAFLDAIGLVGGRGGIIGPGGPNDPSNPTDPGDGSGNTGGSAGGALVINVGDIVVQGGGNADDIGKAVRQVIANDLPVLASRLKREMQTA